MYVVSVFIWYAFSFTESSFQGTNYSHTNQLSTQSCVHLLSHNLSQAGTNKKNPFNTCSFIMQDENNSNESLHITIFTFFRLKYRSHFSSKKLEHIKQLECICKKRKSRILAPNKCIIFHFFVQNIVFISVSS